MCFKEGDHRRNRDLSDGFSTTYNTGETIISGKQGGGMKVQKGRDIIYE